MNLNKICKNLAIIVACALTSQTTSAGEQTGKITNLYVRASDGLIWLEMDGTHSTRPACATHSYWMIQSESSPTGKQQYAALLGAKLAGKTVAIAGNNQCSRWGDGEDINEIQIID